jgi:lia operon protein LiaG
MNSRKIAGVLRILFWGVVAVIAALTMFAFYRGENPFDSINFNHANSGTLSVLHEQTITENITNVNLGWNAGGVTVVASNDDKIRLIERSYENVAQNKWAIVSISGETLKVTSGIKNAFWFFFWHSPETYLEVQLPKKTYDTFKLSVTSGNNKVSDLSVKSLDVNSTSGNLSIKNLTAETVDFNMTSGQTTFENAAAHEFDGVMTSGNMTFDGVIDQNMRLTMTSGQFSTQLRESAPKTIDFQMTSGQARFMLDATADFTLSLNKTSGSFAANFEHTQNGNKYTYKNGKDTYHMGMTSGSLTVDIQK